MLTYYYEQNHGKLRMQSRENGQKPQFWQFLDDFEVKYLQIAHFFEKQVSLKLKVFENFGLIWRPFCEYLQIKNFFQKSSSVTFLSLQSRNFRQKIRKILRAVSENTVLPTNQPSNYYQQHRSYRTSLIQVQQYINYAF